MDLVVAAELLVHQDQVGKDGLDLGQLRSQPLGLESAERVALLDRDRVGLFDPAFQKVGRLEGHHRRRNRFGPRT